MHAIEDAFARECVRTYHARLGYKTMTRVMEVLKDAYGIAYETANNYMYNHSVTHELDEVRGAVVSLLAKHRSELVKWISDDIGPSAAGYLGSLLTDHVGGAGPSQRRPVSNVVAENWGKTAFSGNDVLLSGVYQMFRRYKPEFRRWEEGDGGEPGEAGDSDIIACEVIYVDSSKMEGVLVTSEGSVYWGTFHINHDETLYGIFQRPKEGSDGTLHRFYAVHIERSGRKRLVIYSGLYTKTGDRSRRPVCGESLFLWVNRSSHEPLWNAMIDLFESKYGYIDVSDRPEIMNYVSGAEEDEDRMPVRIADFPLIASLTRPDGDIVLFREPSRALKSEVIGKRAKAAPLEIFCRDRRESGGKGQRASRPKRS